jgi:hypothetical protein
MSMKNSNDIIGNRTRDLPDCSAEPQLTAPPRAYYCILIMKRIYYFRHLTFRPAESEGQPGDAPRPLSNTGPATSHDIETSEKDDTNKTEIRKTSGSPHYVICSSYLYFRQEKLQEIHRETIRSPDIISYCNHILHSYSAQLQATDLDHTR